jgi:hypothetical protein
MKVEIKKQRPLLEFFGRTLVEREFIRPCSLLIEKGKGKSRENTLLQWNFRSKLQLPKRSVKEREEVLYIDTPTQ